MNRIEDKEFVFTGRIKIPRQEAWKLVTKCGGYISPRVRNETDYAVVGNDPGQKFGKAQEKGTQILSEEEFFTWINEALLEVPVTVTEEVKEPEQLDLEISIEDFLKYPPEGTHTVCFICQDCSLVFATHLKKGEVPECPICSLEENMAEYSFNNPETLEKLLKENPDLVLAPAIDCPGCGSRIPYSIWSSTPLRYYCFSCKWYYTRADQEISYEDKNGNTFKKGPGWSAGVVKDVADLYTLTKTVLKFGTGWKRVNSLLEGSVQLESAQGKVVFMEFAELVKSAELINLRDTGNSVEHLLNIRRLIQNSAPDLHSPSVYSKEQNAGLYGQFLQTRQKRLEKRTAARTRRFEKRQARILGVPRPLETPAESSPLDLPLKETTDV